MEPAAEIPTSRCRLEPIRPTDREDIERLYACPDVRRHLGGPVVGEVFVARFDAMLKAPAGQWVARRDEDQSFVGLLSLGLHHDRGDIEVSYQLAADQWGHGLAQETVAAVIGVARSQIRLARLVAETQAANLRSRRLLERLGMTPVRTLIRFDAEQVLYAIDLEPPCA